MFSFEVQPIVAFLIFTAVYTAVLTFTTLKLVK